MTDKKTRGRFVVTEVEIEGRVFRRIAPLVEELESWPRTEIVGQRATRVDGYEKVTGRARYTTDIQLPGMLHAALLVSPHPHARVVRLNVEAALKIPGVKAVLTAKDVAQITFGGPDGPPLLTNEPKYVGEYVAVVAAVDAQTARQAVAALAPEYELLPYVVDIEEAMKPGAPRVRPGGNIASAQDPNRFGEPGIYRRGDPDQGFAQADLVLEHTFRTPAAWHTCMEVHGSVAYWKGRDLFIFDSTQGVFFVQEGLARTLNLPMNRVHVSSRHMGGGFGSKTSAKPYTVLAALLARKTRRPVKLLLTREQDFLGAWYRPPSIQKLKVGLTRNGKLTAIRLEEIHQVGPYPAGARWGECGAPVRELYACPNVETVNYVVFTHTPPPVAMRGPGNTQGAWALEQMMDEAARRLGLDPLDLRLRNIPDHDPVSGQPYASTGLRAALENGARVFGWRQRKVPAPDQNRRRGFGLAAHIWGGGGGPPAGAIVEVNRDGTVNLLTGAADLGTGTRTVLAQIVAEELKIPLDHITVTNADTSTTPYTLPSFGSITLASSGPAARLAAREARQQLTALAALLLDVEPEDLELDVSGFHSRKDPTKKLSFRQVCRRIPSRTLVTHGERGPNPPGQVLRTFGAHFVEVEVDLDTGQVRVQRLVAVHDSGRVINPNTWENQIFGGFTMGLGYGLMEGRVIDRATGRPLNPRFTDYKIPTHADIPPVMEAVNPQVPYPANNIGAKGIGEPPVIPAAPAVANAVRDAIGKRIFASPITPDKVLELLE